MTIADPDDGWHIEHLCHFERSEKSPLPLQIVMIAGKSTITFIPCPGSYRRRAAGTSHFVRCDNLAVVRFIHATCAYHDIRIS